MRNKLLISLIAVVLCGCDNPEEFTHPENPKKPGSVTVTPTGTTTAPAATTTAIATGTTTATTTTTAPVTPPAPRDGSAIKTGDAVIAGDFDSLNVGASLEVDVTVGAPVKVTVECSENSFNDIKLDVKDTTLTVSTRSNFNAAVAKVHITMPKLNSVVAGGSALVKVNGVSGPSFNVATSGTSTVEASGTADTVNVSATGSCCIKMKGLQAKVGSVTTADKCAVEVRLSDEVNATSSGNSVINVFGLPRKVNKHKADQSFIGITNEQ